MAVRFWPYAAKAVVQHVWDTNHLDVWVTFRHPMDQTVKPVNGLWLCEVEGVPKNTSASVWQDEWTILLTVDAVATPPDQVTLEYDGPDENLITTWGKQWEPWGPITSISLPFDWEDIIFIDVVNQRVGILSTPTAYTFQVFSPTLADFIALYHDDDNPYITWNDGRLLLITDEGVNTNTYVYMRGKGTGYGHLRVYDQDNGEWIELWCTFGRAKVTAVGFSPLSLDLNDNAAAEIRCFSSASSGETEPFRIYGFRAGDARRSLDIAVGSALPNTVSFTGLSEYRFTGNVDVSGRISTGHATLAAVGPTDDYDVAGINTLFLDCSGNNVTIGGFANGVAGQVLHLARLCAAANDAKLEHNHPGGTQKIFLHAGADETLTGEYGGWTLACDGANWYDISHAKHV